MAYALYCAWRHGGEDPYLVYHDDHPRVFPSPYPERIRTFRLGMALYAEEREDERGGFKQQRRAMGG